MGNRDKYGTGHRASTDIASLISLSKDKVSVLWTRLLSRCCTKRLTDKCLPYKQKILRTGVTIASSSQCAYPSTEVSHAKESAMNM